jgi:hypothetical protein
MFILQNFYSLYVCLDALIKKKKKKQCNCRNIGIRTKYTYENEVKIIIIYNNNKLMVLGT